MTVQPDTNTPKDEMIAETVVIAEKIVLEGTGYGTWEHRLAEVLLAVVARCEEAEKERDEWITRGEYAEVELDYFKSESERLAARAERAERQLRAIEAAVSWLMGEGDSDFLSSAVALGRVEFNRRYQAALAASGPDTPEDA